MAELSSDLTQRVQASPLLSAAFPPPTEVKQRINLAREVLEVPLHERSPQQQALLYEVLVGIKEADLISALAPAHQYDLRLVELAGLSDEGLRQMTRHLVEEGQVPEACALVARYPDVTLGALLAKVCRTFTPWSESLTTTIDALLARGADAGSRLTHAVAKDIQEQGFVYWDAMEVYDVLHKKLGFLTLHIEEAWKTHLSDYLIGRWLVENLSLTAPRLRVLEELGQRADASTIAQEALGVLESQTDAQAEAEGISTKEYADHHMPALIGELMRVGIGEPWRSIWKASPLLEGLRALDRQDQLAIRPPTRPRRQRPRS